jgi:hypothetical protein
MNNQAAITTVAPMQAPVRADVIPLKLREQPQWVCWRWGMRNGKRTKVPVNPHTGCDGDVTDAATLGTIEQALECCARRGLAGIGFAFTRVDLLTGVDLDKCIDPTTGAVAPWAEQIVADFATYAEISPSGTGIKLFCVGNLPTEKTGTRRPYKTGVVEMYHHGRFFAVTGQIRPDVPSAVEDCQSQLLDLWSRIRPNLKHHGGSRGPPASTPTRADDNEILRRAQQAKNGSKVTRLWNGNIDGFASQSEGDLSLCSILAFWCGPDADAIDRLFRQSGLIRDKWEREDYRNETIAKAIDGCNEFFNWDQTKMFGHQFSSNGAGAKRRNRRGLLVGDPSVADLLESSGRTDIANARRLVSRHGDNMHWCDQWGKWLIWDDRRWAIDRELRVEALAKEIADEIWREVGRRLPELEASEHLELIRFARTTNSARGITNMLALARSESDSRPGGK